MDYILQDFIDRLVSDLHDYHGELYYMKDNPLKAKLNRELEALIDWLDEERNPE